MDRPRLTAKELKRRYRKGERDFAGENLRGESLRGMNLSGVDLSGADLSCTDLCSTNFTDAKLIGANLCESKTGTLRRWAIPKIIISSMITAMASLLTGLMCALAAILAFNPTGQLSASSFDPSELPDAANLVWMDMGIGLCCLITFIGFLTLFYARGALGSLGILTTVVTVGLLFIFILAIPYPELPNNTPIAISAVAMAAAFAILYAFFALLIIFPTAVSSFILVSISGFKTFFSLNFGTFLLAAVVVFIVILHVLLSGGTEAFADNRIIVVIFGFLGSGLNLLVIYSIILRIREGGFRERLVRNISLWVIGLKGSQFRGADLTNADFSKALLKSAHFHQTTDLTNTRFHLAQQADLARPDKTILSDYDVQKLLITLRGRDKTYIGKNLKGAHLIGADLVHADFTEADLSQASLEGADLRQANLTKTQALGTRFRQADLTGACLKAWNIDSTTQLDGTICDYVYLLEPPQERRPSSGIFQAGEFTKLFQEVLDTIDLIFRNGVDWQAFLQTLEQTQREHAEAKVAVQAIENKGDGVVVAKLHAAPDANKEAIHHSFMQGYQKALKALEQKYEAQLQAKDVQIQAKETAIQIYREKSADLVEILKLKAQQPISLETIVKAERRVVHGNDYSQNISYGDNATGNLVQAGQNNTASVEFQQITLPSPDSVNIQADLAALQSILASLNDPVTNGIAEKLNAEAQKPSPDKDIIGKTLETGLTYAQNLQGFAEAMDKLKPHVQNAASWLGKNWYKLLAFVGLAV